MMHRDIVLSDSHMVCTLFFKNFLLSFNRTLSEYLKNQLFGRGYQESHYLVFQSKMILRSLLRHLDYVEVLPSFFAL